jgi:PAS domain S-box-containing protein
MVNNRQQLLSLFDSASDLAQITSLQGHFIYINRAWGRALGYQPSDLIERSFYDLLHPTSRDRYLTAIQTLQATQEEVDLEVTLFTQSQTPLLVKGRISLQSQPAPEQPDAVEVWSLWQIVDDIDSDRACFEDQTDRIQALQDGQNYIVELIARSHPLHDVLKELAYFIEQQATGTFCSFHLLNEDGKTLHQSAAPSLATPYTQAIANLQIGPTATTCGAATYYRQPIITPDISRDPIWEDYRDLALSHHLQACWSVPILAGQEQVLGAIAIYYQEPHAPLPAELDLVKRSAHLASIAIQRHRIEARLQVSEERLHLALNASQMGIWDCDLQTGKVTWSDGLERLYGLPPGQFGGRHRDFLSCVHPEDRHFVAQASKQAIRQRTNFNIEFRIVQPNRQVRWVASRGQVLYDETNTAIRMIGVNLDISDRKLLEESLRKTNYTQGIELAAYSNELTDTIQRLQREIAHRQQVEQALRESEERYRSVIEALQEGIVLQDADGRIQACNSSAERILGLSSVELLERTSLDSRWRAVHEDGSPFPGEEHPAMVTLQTGKPCSDVIMGLTKPNGALIWISINSRPLFRSHESLPHAVVISFSDITTRKQAETALRNSEALYRAIVEDQIELVCRFLPDGTLTFANEAYCQVLGIPNKELIEHCYKMFLLALDQETEAVFTQTLNPANPVSWLEHQVILPSGEVRWQQWSNRAIFDDQGNFIEFQAVGRDITDRKEMEEALKEATERLNGILQSLDDVVWSLSPDTFTFLYISPAAKRVYGYPLSRFYDNPNLWVDVVHPEDRHRVTMTLFQLFDTGIRNIEYRIIRADGAVRWVQDRSWLIHDEHNKPIRMDCMISDITERRQAEMDMCKALEKERELNELKSRFVSMISHEFRTPLTTIQSAAELLQHYEWSAEQKRERFQQIQGAVQHMARLLEDVLLLGRADAGKMQMRPEWLNLEELCRTLMVDLELSISQSYQLHFDCQGYSCLVWIDPKLVRQILTNLLSNAIKYSPDGGIVELKLIYQTDNILLQIRDEGIGIPPTDREQLFEPFYRATNVNTIQGTGLGLAIVKKCVDLCGGQITLDSQVGEGTMFTVRLPLNQPSYSYEEVYVQNFSD